MKQDFESINFKVYDLKKNEFKEEKIFLLRKNRGMKEAKNISIVKAYILCKFLEKEEHIFTIIVGYDLLGMQEILKKMEYIGYLYLININNKFILIILIIF